MRIYLDNCCYNRPYDDQSQIRISLEAQAKIYIQTMIEAGKFELVSSYTEWRKNLFGDASVQEINSAAVEYAKNYSFQPTRNE